MNQTQDTRKRAYIRKEEITIEELVIQEVKTEIIDITHLT
jgi:hypothetical protein